MDVEMETEDEAVHANAEQENVKQARQPPTTDGVAIRLQRFVLKTGESSAGLEAGIKCNKTQAALAACRKVTDSLFQLMDSKIPIDEPSACLFRETQRGDLLQSSPTSVALGISVICAWFIWLVCWVMYWSWLIPSPGFR
ncbi:hypothetical protein JG687_00014233 [Phytophthora cactorum]|uniref:Uncharacterized protein n=1 Tax=Phytophthora cactorum TaxID=29920 RepID=A0A329SP18_9STRA|nr:hypothetical protein Pcac1_g25817 [Phytophthora cactorum]KAG6950479.1 hypothetical protein JG687_00014233 [Phytophthora cactorum]RAW38627.1 hypothetical protein PC110_g5137 [Phytophthora cactorum]